MLYEHEETADDYRDQRDRVWLFLALAKRLEEGMSLPHPDADTLSADFGDPSEVEGLVSFMPVASGEQADHHALAEKLLRYIKENAAHYRERDEQRRSED